MTQSPKDAFPASASEGEGWYVRVSQQVIDENYNGQTYDAMQGIVEALSSEGVAVLDSAEGAYAGEDRVIYFKVNGGLSDDQKKIIREWTGGIPEPVKGETPEAAEYLARQRALQEENPSGFIGGGAPEVS